MQRVIGLDIGSYSVKAVEIVNTFKSYEIANFYENVIPQIDEVPPDAVIPSSMEQLFKENKLEADRIITAMPGQYISSRILSFNFSDVKKIETAIYAEIEDIVPFNLDEMIIDHQILGEVGGKTIALVAMTRQKFSQKFSRTFATFRNRSKTYRYRQLIFLQPRPLYLWQYRESHRGS